MTWLFAALLALAAFAAIAFLFKAQRAGWEAVAAALVAGLAGYATQASPDLPGSPREAAEVVSGDTEMLIRERQELAGQQRINGNKWMIIGDALARNGRFADAASVMLGAVEANPNDSDAWLGIANALVAHADGLLTPAALHAYQQAANAAPDNPGPPFFLGLALAQSGRFIEARNLWAELLRRSPEDAPWRADLQSRLSRLDALIASQAGGMGVTR